MLVTVAICTWNRANLLDQTLCRMRGLRIPADLDWELLIVNNNCTDDTDPVIERYQRDLPIRRLFEPRQGQSHSRNRAVAAAQGEVFIWTDDDVLVDSEWIAAYNNAFANCPDAGFFGGPIEPWFETTPPAWILENIFHLRTMLVLRDLGATQRFFSDGEFPYGANMAFRTELLRTHPFDPILGLNGTSQIRGEESALFLTLQAKGIRGVWVPQACVKHFVVKRRLTRAYLWEWYRGIGQTVARQDFLNRVPQVGKTWGGVPRWLFRQAIESWSLAQWKRLWSQTDWVPDYTRAAFALGAIAEVRSLTRNGGPSRTENHELLSVAQRS